MYYFPQRKKNYTAASNNNVAVKFREFRIVPPPGSFYDVFPESRVKYFRVTDAPPGPNRIALG